MTILAGDVKLVASQVMDDVDNGGGAPTATVITDGASNGVFNDISELDRAGGRVNLRKLFASVQTDNTDGYFGANVIVADPPADPLVSVSLFTTSDVFDRRTDAQDRMESYLALGPVYSGYLFGDHIAGQMVVTILQRDGVPLPAVGETFVLVGKPGAVDEVQQYVRVTQVASTVRTFTDGQGDFTRVQVTLDISDALRYDFSGFDALRIDSAINYTGKTKFHATIVADAARYYGVVPLEVTAEIGDYTIQGTGIFTQLVPSTRVEVPIADARLNQQSVELIDGGAEYTRSLTLAFTTSQSLYVGGSILPGSLSITRGGITLSDKGGTLINSSTEQVGTIDYENGVLALSTNVFGASAGSHTVVYKPAARPTLVADSVAELVTQAGQRLSYTLTLNVIPARGTLQVSYRTLGRWYVLSDDGSGLLRGGDSAFGAGTLNYTTGTVSVTLGALPDVDSSVIFTFASASSSIPVQQLIQAGPSQPRAFGKVVSVGQAVVPGSTAFSWNDGAARTATDSGGAITGDASGYVNYATGEIVFRPNTLPAKDTTIALTIDTQTAYEDAVVAMTDGGSTWTFSLGAAVEAHSVAIALVAYYTKNTGGFTSSPYTTSIRVLDDGAGNLFTSNQDGNLNVGTVNYASGACVINKSIAGYKFSNTVYRYAFMPGGVGGFTGGGTVPAGEEIVTGTLTIANGTGPSATQSVPWAWWTGVQGNAVEYRFSGGASSGDVFNFTLDSLFMPNNINAYTNTVGYSPKLTSFLLGSDFYVKQDATWVRNPSATNGAGTAAGSDSVVGGVAGVLLTSWTAGTSSGPTSVAGSASPNLTGAGSPLSVTQVTFRTAISPLLNSAFSIVANWLDTGVQISATANSSGVINTGGAPADADSYGTSGMFAVVNYEMGVATVYFGERAGSNLSAADGVIDITPLGIPGVSLIRQRSVQADTLRYNAVGYNYLPLDANILGLDPVRLPPDGRVPIFRAGSFAVVGHTGEITGTYSNSDTVDCGRVRLSRVRIVGNDGNVISTGYTVNLDTGIVTIVDITGWSQPVTIQHRIEDMMLVSQAQINGQLTFTRPLTHDYPLGSYISSALIAGDRRAYVSELFDQATWNNVWSDGVSGSSATGTYNDILHPIEVTNRGTLTERWAIQFINSTSFNVIGEHVGVIATGNTSSDLAPTNPATSTPYFTLRSAGWGLGWATGNVLRFNTVGTLFPIWVARTILQGPETVDDDSFTMLIRGDVDNP